MEIFNDTSWILPLVTLFFMELVLGIDNIIFISILVDKVPEAKRKSTMRLGIALAVGLRILLLFFIGWLVGLTEPIATIGRFNLSGRDVILFGGGFFLMVKTIMELRHKLSGNVQQQKNIHASGAIGKIILQIIFVDLIFSFDSILTAVGLVDSVAMMIVAVLGSTIVVVIMAQNISNFINQNPSIKILALSFLLLIGGYLIFEALHVQFDKTLLYFGMGFAFFNELLNLQFKRANND